MKRIIIFLCAYIIFCKAYSQKFDIGLGYGRLHAIYSSIDYGSGFRKMSRNQYNLYPSIFLNVNLKNRKSIEGILSVLQYGQYTATRLYGPGFFSRFYSINLSCAINYSIVQCPKFEWRIKAGVALSVIPDQYQGEFKEIFLDDQNMVDSISRGHIKRDYTPVAPAITVGSDIAYAIKKRIKLSLLFNYQAGLTKITQYDIFYNDGSGSNDQQAKQWGNGSFWGVQLGVRYVLKNKK